MKTYQSLLRLASNALQLFLMAMSLQLVGVSVSAAGQGESPAYRLDRPGTWVEHSAPDYQQLGHLANSEQSLHYLLVDRQIRFGSDEPEDIEHFSRYAYQIRNVDGLQNGSGNSVEYDPRYEQLIFHRVSVWRDGIESNRTEAAKFQLLNNEREREELIYSGEYSLDFVLADTRVGDVVDYSYTITGSNPIFGGLREFGFSQDWGVPVERVNYRVLAPSGVNLIQRHRGAAEAFSRVEGVDSTEYRFVGHQLVARDHAEASSTVLSNVENWRAIVDWGIPLYADVLLRGRGVDLVAAEIQEKHSTEAAQIGAALAWAQENVRYLGLEYGTNSHQPSAAQVTLSRRFGDCKDKAVLLVAILKALGIKSEPALVYSGEHDPLLNSPHRLHAFNHVVVHVELAGRSHWLDPTKLYQKGALGEFSEESHGYALIIDAGQNQLTKMSGNVSESRVDVSKTFLLSEDGSVDMRISTRRTLAEAERHRAALVQSGQSEMANRYEGYYREAIKGLEVIADLSVEDSADNSMLTTEQYRFDFDPSDEELNGSLYVGTDDIDGVLRQFENLEAGESDVALSGPFFVEETIEIQYDQPVLRDEEKSHIDNDYFRFIYSFKTNEEERKSTLYYSLKVKNRSVSAEALDDLKAEAARARELTFYSLKWPLLDSGGYQLSGWGLLAKQWADQFLFGVFIVFAVIYLYAFIEWQLDRRRAVIGGVFYPVSPLKFCLMSFTTMGVYLIFYFYRSFRYSRDHLGRKIWPGARAMFSVFFLYSLYQQVRVIAQQKSQGIRVSKGAAALLAVLYFVFGLMGNAFLPMITALIAAACVFPLMRWVNALNSSEHAAMIQHSRIRPRHIMLVIASPFLFMTTVMSELNLVPSDSVVREWQVWGFQERFIRERRVLAADEKIELFYSDAFLDFRLDGNGMSNQGLFSYWVTDSGEFQHGSIEFSDITSVNIRSSSQGSQLNSAVIEARSVSGGELSVLLPDIDRCRARFITELRAALPSSARFNCKS